MSIEEKISAYFDGELSPQERSALEAELTSNPELKKEYDFQSEVIEGIKSARKAELKAMLNKVPVGGAGVTGPEKFLQYASVIAITAFIGFGIYYFWPQDQIQAMQEEQPAIEEFVQEALTEKSTPIEPPEETSTPDVDANSITSSEPVITPEEKKPAVTKEKPAEGTQEVNTERVRPTILEGLETEESTDPDAPENDLSGKTKYGAEPIIGEINTEMRKYNFHYQFAAGKLVLYGEFSETYEILDFMQGDERAVYLFYTGGYYSLKINQVEITPLEKITDPKIITDLEKRRKSGQ